VIVDVSAKLIKEFVECLEDKLANQGTGAVA
jgi:carbon monoxide dehydrogenase subunit G